MTSKAPALLPAQAACEKVAQAMDRLPLKEQQVLQGMYLEDRPAQAVADAIDVSLGHVYRLICAVPQIIYHASSDTV